MAKTNIEWVANPDGTQGESWNPITGCLNGCPYCYARKIASGRLKGRYLANTILPSHDEIDHEAHQADPFYPRFWPSKFEDIARKHTRPRGIFVCDMADLFGAKIPKNWQDKVFETIRSHHCRNDRFYLLTKQPQNLARWSPFPDNCWVGVSAVDSSSLSRAAYGLAHIQAKVKFVSAEPLLSPFPVAKMTAGILKSAGVGWLIVGQQTPASEKTRPKIEWIEEMATAADKAGVPVFLKDNLISAFWVNGHKDHVYLPSWATAYGVYRQEFPQI